MHIFLFPLDNQFPLYPNADYSVIKRKSRLHIGRPRKEKDNCKKIENWPSYGNFCLPYDLVVSFLANIPNFIGVASVFC